ncbi:MAG: alpha-galactosidase [Abditibacteriota bacterium]|nr:alpha-galactosidase [Abditibacteriota bacterium]
MLKFVLTVFLALAVSASYAVTVSEKEMSAINAWYEAKFEGKSQPTPDYPAGIIVLQNFHDANLNHRYGNVKLSLAGKDYDDGIFAHGPSDILISLPSAGKRFTALCGIDGRSDGGNVIMTVSAGGKELFTSGEIKFGEMREIDIDLRGAASFNLKVDINGDVASDQCAWVNPKVELENGKTINVSRDLKFIDSGKRPPVPELPFSFVYGGKSSRDFLGDWAYSVKSEKPEPHKTLVHHKWFDPATKLELRCEAVRYDDYPVVEWTLWFENTGAADTPILSNIKAIDTELGRTTEQSFNIHHDIGTNVREDDFAPVVTTVPHIAGFDFDANVHIEPRNGRACGGASPYFNIDCGNCGYILALGWPGQWQLDCAGTRTNTAHLSAGQKFFNSVLRPGEKVRSSLSVFLPYDGDYLRSQNIWRRFYIDHIVPRVDGKAPEPMTCGVTSGFFYEMINASTENQIEFIEKMAKHKIPITHWWMDAGWYPNNGDWPNTGTWEVDQKRFPGGFKPISDVAHKHGYKVIVWFEPERAAGENWIRSNHPDWLLGGDPGWALVDIGNPECLEWAQKHFSKFIKDNGIDLYRQDYNIEPLSYWQYGETPDRVGYRENRYIQGYLAFWDYLLADNPGLRIDSCASGGHRNDIETMKRSIPLLRTDWHTITGDQNMSYSLASWLPWTGTGIGGKAGSYDNRSTMLPVNETIDDVRPDNYDPTDYINSFKERAMLIDFMLKDYYPLTPYDKTDKAFMAWQFDDPERGAGYVAFFRREKCITKTVQTPLYGLEPESEYLLNDLDNGSMGKFKGSDLLKEGLDLTLNSKRAAGIIVYEKVK